jgi:beta-N-acetylhexosaminidase
MVGHVIIDSVDPSQTASRSRAVIDGVIRQGWGFQGPIITDDLTMPSFLHHDFCRGVPGALEAGADLLLISYDGDQYYRAFECALAGWRRGAIPHLRPVAARQQGGKIAARAAKSNGISARSHIAVL